MPFHVRDNHTKACVPSQTEAREGSLFCGNTQPNILLTNMNLGSDTK